MEQHYVGLDVGLEETSLCIVDSEGKTVREVKVSTEPAAIRCALEGYADRLSRIGVEASSLGLWLYRELQEGLPIIVVEARHMRVSLSTMRNKTDRNDARGIAQMMRLGWFRAVHVKNVEMQKMRTLLTNRKLLKRKLVDIESHIRGALRTYGLLVGAVSRGQYEARVRELIERTDIVFLTMIETMLDVRRAILDGYTKLHRVLLQMVQHDQICRRLMTVPGVTLPLLPALLFPTRILQGFRMFAGFFLADQIRHPASERLGRQPVLAAIIRARHPALTPGLNVQRPIRAVRLYPGPRCHRRFSHVRENPIWNDTALSESRARFGRLRSPD